MFDLNKEATRQRKLVKKWRPMIEAGNTKIVNESVKKALAQVFENTYQKIAEKGLLVEAGLAQADVMGADGQVLAGPNGNKGVMTGTLGREHGGTGDFYLPNVIMPMLRRIVPNLIANELVGVQALNAPLGYALAYRAIYGKNSAKIADAHGNMAYDMDTKPYGADADELREIGFNPVDTRHSGVEGAALTAFGDKSSETLAAWAAYAGKQGVRDWAGEGATLGNSEYASFADGTYPQVAFRLIKTAVEAKTRKLGSEWSPELAEDLQAMHGIDVENEMVDTVSYEIGAEIDRQIVTEMVKAAITGGSVTSWSPVYADGLDQMGRLATLLTQITIEANMIALKTRRGNANFVITSPRVTALLEQMSLNKFVSMQNTSKEPSVPDTGVGAITKCGLINDGQQLLVRDAYAPGDYLIMGYKGTRPTDSGIIYCPYVPVQMSKCLDPFTFVNRIGARTRYGVMNSVWDSKNYYHFIRIADLTKDYTWGGERKFIQNTAYPDNGTLFK